MHKLHRPTTPRCLSRYKYGRDNWGTVSTIDKNEIWIQLDSMQQSRCAYCESAISELIGQHIEHFIQRTKHKALTFEWTNIFGACRNHGYCADHKDDSEVVYDTTHIIKPDVEDPDNFFIFVSDGKIKPREQLNPDDLHRATETIRVFNLNSPSLQGRRATVVGGVWQTLEDLKGFAAEFSESEWMPFYVSELDRVEQQPFSTALRHALVF